MNWLKSREAVTRSHLSKIELIIEAGYAERQVFIDTNEAILSRDRIALAQVFFSW
jgi:hypothetical protein